MQYYNKDILQKQPQIIDYFRQAIKNPDKNIGHGVLFWGADIQVQCELALEIARILNCRENADENCDCINCRWIRSQTHPAVKIITRLDFKDSTSDAVDGETSTKGTKNISISQAKSVISELSVTSDYHRVYIFCDRNEDGDLLPLNKINFPEATSNALLKTFEEPPQNTTFFFLTKDKSDIISTIVSRLQTFFVPGFCRETNDTNLVDNLLNNYKELDKNKVLDFETSLMNVISEKDAKLVLSQMQNYMLNLIKNNLDNKLFFYKILKDLENVEIAIRQLSLSPSMDVQTVVENLCFKLILEK